MSDTVLITLIVAIAILLALVLFRSQLSRFFFKASKEGMEAGLETHKPNKAVDASRRSGQASAGVEISGNKQKGSANEINAERNNSRISNNDQTGKGNKINVKSDKPQA